MKVLVDTSIWSLALRRKTPESFLEVQEFKKLIENNQVCIIGPIRQEILSGIKDENQFKILEKHLSAFPDLNLITEDYIQATKYFNICTKHGIQGSNTDFLISACAIRNNYYLYTTDKDFTYFKKYIPLKLHSIQRIIN